MLKENRLGKDERNGAATCFDSLKGLLECPSISHLDIQNNYIEDEKILEEILAKMPNLSVLLCKGNNFVKKIKNYRKTLIA